MHISSRGGYGIPSCDFLSFCEPLNSLRHLIRFGRMCPASRPERYVLMTKDDIRIPSLWYKSYLLSPEQIVWQVGNYNSGLEQPESEPEEQIHNHPQSELDEELELGEELELDESEDDDLMFVGAVAAKMVRGELQLLIRWEAGDNHTRHPQLHCLA